MPVGSSEALRPRRALGLAVGIIAVATVGCTAGSEEPTVAGAWYHAHLTGREPEQIPFFLHVPDDCAAGPATIVNGEERINWQVNPLLRYEHNREIFERVDTGNNTRTLQTALILDAPMPGILRMARAQSRVLVPLSILLVRARYDTVAAIRRVRAPTLVFHGEDDELVPCELGREVYDAALGPKEWRPIPGGGHNDTYMIAGSAYFDAITEFLDRHVG